MKNLIIYNLQSIHRFTDYGIKIPLLNERVLETITCLGQKYEIEESIYEPISIIDLALAHDKEFINRVKNDPAGVVKQTYELVDENGNYNRYDPTLTKRPLEEFILKARLHVRGTYICARKALESGFCYHLGGGMHHAMSFKPGGFCMFNDLVISLRKLQKNGKIKKAAIIDIDCHKGDGSAQITKEDDSIKTFSIHMKDGWPLDNKDNHDSFIPSDLDIPVDNSTNYLQLLKKGLTDFLKKNCDIDLALVVHGVDVWEKDVLPSSSGIQLSSSEVLERDLFVYSSLKQLDIPQAWCLGGGYGEGVSELYLQFLLAREKV